MRFQHDCTACVCLGTFEDPDEGYLEFYWCSNKGSPSLDSVIARYGNEGHEYIAYHPPEAFADASSLLTRHPWYVEILKRAQERGLYKP